MKKNNQHNDLYRLDIIDHYKNPRNFKEIPQADIVQEKLNRYCGDELTLYCQVKNNKITDIGFQGRGCAISLASASKLFAEAKGKPLSDVQSWPEQKPFQLLGIPTTTGRKKCVLLAWQALQDGILKYLKQPD